MTKQFAEEKLNALYEAYVAVLIDNGKTPEEAAALFAVDAEMQRVIRKRDEFPTTKDNYGAYLGLIGKDGAKAVLIWKNGGNPVGILTALLLNNGKQLPQ